MNQGAPTATTYAQPSKEADAENNTIYSTMNNDPDYNEIIEDFVRGLPGRLQEIEAAINKEAILDLKRLAHQLKGAGGSFGFPTLSDCSEKLETIAESGNSEQLQIHLSELQQICDQMTNGLQTQGVI